MQEAITTWAVDVPTAPLSPPPTRHTMTTFPPLVTNLSSPPPHNWMTARRVTRVSYYVTFVLMSTLFRKSTLTYRSGPVISMHVYTTPPPTTRTRLILPSPCPQPGQGEAKIHAPKPPLDANVCAKSSRCSRQNPTSHNLTSRACPTSYASCTGANRPPLTTTSLTAPAQK